MHHSRVLGPVCAIALLQLTPACDSSGTGGKTTGGAAAGGNIGSSNMGGSKATFVSAGSGGTSSGGLSTTGAGTSGGTTSASSAGGSKNTGGSTISADGRGLAVVLDTDTKIPKWVELPLPARNQRASPG